MGEAIDLRFRSGGVSFPLSLLMTPRPDSTSNFKTPHIKGDGSTGAQEGGAAGPQLPAPAAIPPA